ncbi:unnamed protein product [Closterium sp. Naga37s-1]|nr:unnamed protein product [Closterium sp. Naga37s-1]
MSLGHRSPPDPPHLAADSPQADTSSAVPSSDSRRASFDTPEARRFDEVAELASCIAASGDAETSVPSSPRGDTGDARSGSSSSGHATGETASASDQLRPTRRRGGWLAAVAGLLVRSPLGALCRTLGRSDPPHMLPPPVEPRPSLSAARATARASARAAAAAAVAASPEGAGSVAGASSVSDYSLDGSPAASDMASSASPPSSRPSTPPPRAAVLPALPSPPSPVLSPADLVLIQDVRSALEDADVDTQDWLTDDTVLRYAVPGKRHVATMVNRIRATATWRCSFRLLAPAEVLCSPWRPFGYWHGADVDGRPCLVLHVGRAAKAIPSAFHADFVCYLASLVSAVTTALTLACPDSGRIAVILDCQGAPALWHLPVGLLRATITALHRNFPHRMARLHVLHLPPALRLLARAMLQLLSPGTRSKIQIIGGGSSSTSSISDLFGLQVSVPARLAGGCICAVCCEGEAEGETGGGGGPRTEQRHGESGGEAGAAAQAGLTAGAEAARGASLSGPSDSLPLEHPSKLAPAVTTPACVTPAVFAYAAPQPLPPCLSSTLRQRAGGVAGGGVGREKVGEPARGVEDAAATAHGPHSHRPLPLLCCCHG